MGFVFYRFGRKRATQISIVLMFIFSMTTGLCPNVYLYMISQFLVEMGFGGYRLNSIILGTAQSHSNLFFISSLVFLSLYSPVAYSSTSHNVTRVIHEELDNFSLLPHQRHLMNSDFLYVPAVKC